MRAFAAIPIAVVVCAAAPAFADASHVNAAHKAERHGDWRKALQEWKAAYAAEPNAEYLIGIGDARQSWIPRRSRVCLTHRSI